VGWAAHFCVNDNPHRQLFSIMISMIDSALML
jgi:hypothetical protein